MAINIKPSHINIQPGGHPGGGARAFTGKPEKITTPARATENIVPSPETLQTMVRSGIAALRSGTFWDRGTIINILA